MGFFTPQEWDFIEGVVFTERSGFLHSTQEWSSLRGVHFTERSEVSSLPRSGFH